MSGNDMDRVPESSTNHIVSVTSLHIIVPSATSNSSTIQKISYFYEDAMRARFRPSYSICPVRRSCYRTPKPYLMSSTAFSPTSPRISPQGATTRLVSSNGDLNNTSAVRPVTEIAVDAAFVRQSLAIQESDDEPDIRRQFRPFLLDKEIADSDWIAHLEISTAMRMAYEEMHRLNGSRLKVLVLYGSLRERCVTCFKKLCSTSRHQAV